MEKKNTQNINLCFYRLNRLKHFFYLFRVYELSAHEFNSHSEPALYSYSNFIVCSVSGFIWAVAFVSRHVYLIKVS